MGEPAEACILVVDDKATDAELTLHAIGRSKMPLHVVWIADGRAALRYLMQAQSSEPASSIPRLMLLDHDMPSLSGASVLERVRMESRLARLPVVMLSSNDDPQLMRRCLDLGANAFVTKPVGFHAYMSRIQGIVEYWLSTPSATQSGNTGVPADTALSTSDASSPERS